MPKFCHYCNNNYYWLLLLTTAVLQNAEQVWCCGRRCADLPQLHGPAPSVPRREPPSTVLWMAVSISRVGVHFHSPSFSGAFSPSLPPPPPLDVAVICFFFFPPLMSVEEVVEGEAGMSLGPYVWRPRWWPWLYLDWLLVPILKDSVWIFDLVCKAGQHIFPKLAFGLLSLHQRREAVSGDALASSSQSYCPSLIVSAAAWLSRFCSHDPSFSWWRESWCSCTFYAPRTGLLRFRSAWIVSWAASWLRGKGNRDD